MAPHATFDEELARAGLAKARDKDLAEGLRKEFISMEAELEHERNERERQARDQPGLAGGGLFGFGRGWSEESGGLFNFNHMMKKIIDNVQVTKAARAHHSLESGTVTDQPGTRTALPARPRGARPPRSRCKAFKV